MSYTITAEEILAAFEITDFELAAEIVEVCETGYRHGLDGWYQDGEYASDADWVNGVGATIQTIENLRLEADDSPVFDLYCEAHAQGLEDRVSPPDAVQITVENTEDDPFTVCLHINDTSKGPAWCDHHGSLGGSSWEDAGDGFMYDMIRWTPTLFDELKAYGCDLDFSQWSDPEEEDFEIARQMEEGEDFLTARKRLSKTG